MNLSSTRSLAKHIVGATKTGTPLRHARGVVVSSTIGTTVVTLDGGATNVTAINYAHAQNLTAGTVVDVLIVGRKAYVLGAYTAPASGVIVQTQAWNASLSGAGATGSLSSWFSFSGSPSLSFAKRFAGTKILVRGTASGYATGAVGAVQFGLNWPGNNFQIAHYYFSALSDHRTIGCMGIITGVAAGTTAFAAIYSTASGVTFNADTNDTWMLEFTEVW